MPIYYYDYYTMSLGNTNIAVLNPDVNSNALFLHNPAGLAYIPRTEHQFIRIPIQIISRHIAPTRKNPYDWGARIIQTFWDEGRIAYGLTTSDWTDIQDMSSNDTLVTNLLEPSAEFQNNLFYQVYYDELGYWVNGNMDLYSGRKTLPEIYETNPKFEKYMINQQNNSSYVKSSFSNTELVARMDTRTTFGLMGKMVDKLFGMKDIFENVLSWDFGVTGFIHPRISSFFETKEGPYLPYFAVDLEADFGYSLAIAKKIEMDIGASGPMPVSFGLRNNRLYRGNLDSYLTVSSIISTLALSGADNNSEIMDALLNDVIDKSAFGVADFWDFGFLVEHPDIPIMLGFVINNIGSTDLFQGELERGPAGNFIGIKTNDTIVGEPIPQTLGIGGSYRTKVGMQERNLLLAMDVKDIGIPNQSIFLKLHMGTEFELVKNSAWIRAGVNQGYVTYGLSALIKIGFLKWYLELSKYEAEQFTSRLPGEHTSDPYYTYGLKFSLFSNNRAIKNKVKLQNKKLQYI